MANSSDGFINGLLCSQVVVDNASQCCNIFHEKDTERHMKKMVSTTILAPNCPSACIKKENKLMDGLILTCVGTVRPIGLHHIKCRLGSGCGTTWSKGYLSPCPMSHTCYLCDATQIYASESHCWQFNPKLDAEHPWAFNISNAQPLLEDLLPGTAPLPMISSFVELLYILLCAYMIMEFP